MITNVERYEKCKYIFHDSINTCLSCGFSFRILEFPTTFRALMHPVLHHFKVFLVSFNLSLRKYMFEN